VVLEASRSVTIVRPRQGSPLAAAVGTRLYQGDQVRVPPGSHALVLFRSGKVENLTSSLTLGPGESNPTQLGRLVAAVERDAASPGRHAPPDRGDTGADRAAR
jgi:hypothetical protein